MANHDRVRSEGTRLTKKKEDGAELVKKEFLEKGIREEEKHVDKRRKSNWNSCRERETEYVKWLRIMP